MSKYKSVSDSTFWALDYIYVIACQALFMSTLLFIQLMVDEYFGFGCLDLEL